MNITTGEIAQICGGALYGQDAAVNSVSFDSRSASACEPTSLFVALCGQTRDGHDYIETLRQAGARRFMVNRRYKLPTLGKDESFIVVEDTLKALQSLAAHQRSLLEGCVAAVTGSNGKTIVKEWIAALWDDASSRLFVSPKSYNSQIGVAVSLTMSDPEASLSVFEAGISQTGEMARLREMIDPDIVVVTNIGDAHGANFSSRAEKLGEKLILAERAKAVVYCRDMEEVASAIEKRYAYKKLFSWGYSAGASLRIKSLSRDSKGTHLRIETGGREFETTLPFIDKASVENLLSALSFYACLDKVTGSARFIDALGNIGKLRSVAMRLEQHQGVCNSVIVNDSYNSDLSSFSIALDYLSLLAASARKVVILSDMAQSGYTRKELYAKAASMMKSSGIDTLHAIGPDITASKSLFEGLDATFHNSTQDFIASFDRESIRDSYVLVKGSRSFALERVSRLIELHRHSTVMEVDLGAMCHNLNRHRALLRDGVKSVAMVKARSYGHGDVEVAAALEKRHIDYFAVAYADEGVLLREGGIKTPIIVLNSEPSGFAAMIEYGLEPEIYDFDALDLFCDEVRRAAVSSYPIHIKFDTGMHRLGFTPDEIDSLVARLKDERAVKVRSVFSHFTSSDTPEDDEFTHRQIELFSSMSSRLRDGLGDHTILRHLSNTWGIERFPEAQFDMVRLGLGLYGISPFIDDLRSVAALKSTISHISHLPAGSTVGYNRRGVLSKDSVIATVPIGYADGLRRALSCGKWSFKVGDAEAPIVGNICMDACMIDITGIPAAVGDTVTIFDGSEDIVRMAEVLGTIPYEVLTSISPRVKRVYFD